MPKQNPRLISSEQGMVAIVTTMILMIVISLIVLGFSQIVRRNTRQVTDAQLSSQAFYAAESGLNLAKSQVGQNSDYTNKSNCAKPASGPDYKINEQTEITCLLTHNPDHLRFDGVNSNASRVSLIKKEDGTALDELTITWQNNSPDAQTVRDCTGGGNLPTAVPDAWDCNQPLLRIDLVPVKDTNNVRSDLIANQFTAFLYPSNSSGGDTAWSDSVGNNKGNIIMTECNDGHTGLDLKCKVTITGLTANQYAVRMMSLYETSDVITYPRNRPTLVGGQVIVDSTARSQDVIKRIRARVPVTSNSNAGTIPNFAIDTGSDLCKRYKVSATEATSESPAPGCLN